MTVSEPFLIEQLACFIAEHKFSADAELRSVVRDSVIDTFGCILAGSLEEPAVLARHCFDQIEFGGSSVYGTSTKSAPENAALLNAVAGHSLDMDDWEIPGNSHASVVILPALLAASEGESLSGDAVCEAYIVGFEVVARLGEAINFEHYSRGWHTTSTLAAVGAAAAVSRLWQLDLELTVNALSLSVSRAGGLTRQFGSHAKALQAGFSAQAGLSAAQFARAGLTGQPHVLEGRQGYFELTGHGDRLRYEKPFRNLGQRLALEQYGQVIKPYPSCGYTHRIIDCARKISREGLDWRLIDSITIELPDFHAEILPFRQPKNRREALFSLPFCGAMGLLHGDLTLQHLDAEIWNTYPVQKLISISKVEPFTPQRPDLNYDPEQPDRLMLKMSDGEHIEASIEYPRGAPQNRLALEEIVEKFVTNASRFCLPSDSQIERLRNWPDLDDILPLFSSLGVTK